MGDFSSDDFNGLGTFQDFSDQPDASWRGGGFVGRQPWQPPPWQRQPKGANAEQQQLYHYSQMQPIGHSDYHYKPRPFPTSSSRAFKRPAPWQARPPVQPPKQRVESNEKSFVMPGDAPENFVSLVNLSRCELCKASINSVVNAEMHYNGKAHQKRLKENGLPVGEYFSGILKIQSASVPAAICQQTSDESATRDSTLRGPSGLPDLPEGLETDCCRLCGVTFTNTIQAHQHYAGKKHRSNAIDGRKIALAKEATPKVFRCDLCDIVTNSQAALSSHQNGQKHKTNERQREAKMALLKRQEMLANSRATGASSANAISAFVSGMRSASF